MIPQGLKEVARLLAYCFRAVEGIRPLLAVFIVLSLAAALTEGFGISLLVPFLEASRTDGSALANNPLFSRLFAWTKLISPDHRLAMIAGILLVVVCLRGLLLYASEVLSEFVPLRLQRRLMAQAYRKLLHVEVGYLTRSSVGALTDAIAQLPVRISSLILQIAAATFSSILAFAYVLLMLAVSWQMTVASVIFFGIITTILRATFSDQLRKAGEAVTTVSAHNSTLLHETINGLRLVRLSSAEMVMDRSFSENIAALIRAKVRVTLIRAANSPVLSTAAGAFICALLAANDLFGLGYGGDWATSVLIFNVLVFRLLSPVAAINNARHYLFADICAFDEYRRLLDELDQNRQRSGTKTIASIREGLHFESVRFAYPGQDISILNDFSLKIKKGEMIALVGPSGAGKSTVAALLARLYDPDSGRVAVDNTDLREVEVSSWHQMIGVVSQEAFIFNDTLANNLRFGKQEVGEEELYRALKRAAADDIVAGLPDGLQTLLGERGGRLSGGQVQRIALARVLLSNPQLLILDEATSNLDSRTEAAIQRTIEEIRPGLTILAIAHRLSTIVKADRIVVVEKGAIRAIGTHAELEANNSLYREFLRHQTATAA